MEETIRIIIHAIELLDQKKNETTAEYLKTELGILQRKMVYSLLETRKILGDKETIELIEEVRGAIEALS